MVFDKVFAVFALVTLGGPIVDADKWGPWGECSKTCGSGLQDRRLMCPGANGVDTVCNIDTAQCNIRLCEDPFAGSKWSDCDQPCGPGGERSRTGSGGEVHTIGCNQFTCAPVKGECRADVVLLLDSSGSLTEMNWPVVKQFTMDFTYKLKVNQNGTHIGVVRFSNEVSRDLNLDEHESSDQSAIGEFIWELEWMAGKTNIAGGLEMMALVSTETGRSGVQQIGLFLTDGHATVNEDDTMSMAQAAKAAGMTIISVGVTDFVKVTELGQIASSPEDAYWVADFPALVDILDDIIERTCIIRIIECDTCEYGPCDGECDMLGLKKGSQECQVVNKNTGEVIRTYTQACDDIVCPMDKCTHPGVCARCDYTKGHIWVEHENCHLFIVCEKISEDEYRQHVMTCGDLFWDQFAHTCVEEPPHGDPDCGVVVMYKQPSTTKAPCPYLPLDDPQYFSAAGSVEVQECRSGFVFVVDPDCTCLPFNLVDVCEDDLLLDFPFDDDFNDHTCHRAIGDPCGEGVLELVTDAERDGKVLHFGGGKFLEVRFMQTWFAYNSVDKMSISLWFKRAIGTGSNEAGLVNNGDCEDDASFEVNVDGSGVYAGIGTEHNQFRLPSISVNENKWYHAVWVYNSGELKFYLNGPQPAAFNPSPVDSGSAAGFMRNPDVPLYMGNLDGIVFEGYLDDVRVWERVLSVSNIQDLYKED